MPFLRQLYKQKPQAWGPVSSVQASIFKNAERIGIDINKDDIILPIWEKAGAKLINYVDGSVFVPTSSTPSWVSDGIYVNPASTQAYKCNTTKAFLADEKFTVISRIAVKTQTAASMALCSPSPNSNLYKWSFYAETYNNTGKLGINIDISSNIASNLITPPNGVPTTVGFKRDATTAIFYSGTNKSTNVTIPYIQDSGSGFVIGTRSTGASYFDGEFHFFYLFRSLLTDAQCFYHSDNPYYLLHRVAPVFYSVPGGAGGVTISSTTGTVVVTVYDVGIETGVTISVNTGIITGIGFNVEVEQGTSIKATTGEISINGLNPDIVQGIQFIVTQGMVAINGFDTTVLNGTEINVTSKNVSITGYAVEVEQGIIITSSIESVVITGYNVSVTNELVISLNVGSVIIAGYNTTVLAGMKIDLTKAEITITGLDLEIEQGTQIDVTLETVTVTGLDVSVENALSIKVTTGSVNVLGYPVNVYVGILIEATTGNVAITGYNPTVAQSSGVEVTTGQVTITGLDTTIECTVLIEPTTGMVIIASYAVTVTDGLVAETPITRTNVVTASNRVITNSGSSRLMTNSNSSRLIVIT